MAMNENDTWAGLMMDEAKEVFWQNSSNPLSEAYMVALLASPLEEVTPEEIAAWKAEAECRRQKEELVKAHLASLAHKAREAGDETLAREWELAAEAYDERL